MTGSGWRGGFAILLAAAAALPVCATRAQDDGALLAPIPDRRADHEEREGRIAQRLQYARQRWAQEQRIPERRGTAGNAVVPLASSQPLPERESSEALRRFHQALAALGGIAPQDAWYVGDMPEMDIVGANAVGMCSVLTTEDRSVIGDAPSIGPAGQPDHVIGSLDELLPLLGLPAPASRARA